MRIPIRLCSIRLSMMDVCGESVSAMPSPALWSIWLPTMVLPVEWLSITTPFSWFPVDRFPTTRLLVTPVDKMIPCDRLPIARLSLNRSFVEEVCGSMP